MVKDRWRFPWGRQRLRPLEALSQQGIARRLDAALHLFHKFTPAQPGWNRFEKFEHDGAGMFGNAIGWPMDA